ncbi:peptidoglycan-binding domain-containing protein [Pararoseomonas indoligenes]|uniref:Peptidoglycan-binding protein n=1 Tax=Roseomonas indoligenes TaxID=2820811 RepID=A0A940MZX1_9PROT|nr:peptidoglycan-binding domain-containing protein [Pararoseomonas indoligenes]MBP0491767.1 peptidoglycan-binding protein [Pararoseomonas indoligenes]
MPLQSARLSGNAALRQIETKARPSLAMGRTTNDSGAVKLVQEALKSLGEDLGGDWVQPSSGNGWYGQHTVNAVTSFQTKAFPTTAAEWDGKVGQKTLRALDARLLAGPPAPAPAPNSDPVPPPGVLPGQQDWFEIRFDPPLFYSAGVKISLVDPILMPVVSSVMAQFGIHVPHGADFSLGLMRRLGSARDLGSVMASGALFGVTQRSGVLPLSLPQVIAWAKANGAGDGLVKVLESLSGALAAVPTSGAISCGLVVIVATGFPNVGAMHGHLSGAQDEAAFNLAVGNTKGLTKLIKIAIESGGHAADLINLGSSGYETYKNLSNMKEKAIVVMDIPGLSLGIDIGFSATRSKFYSVDLDALVQRLWSAIPFGNDGRPWIMSNSGVPRLVAPHQGLMRVRSSI